MPNVAEVEFEKVILIDNDGHKNHVPHGGRGKSGVGRISH
jgi:hypothetical protein